ncbi:hypothetical protein AKJ09_08435 [Labilithrix luteola]|uniref:Outer membrane lipoprotein carrier protein LolA n=1 Tax=Labilithrix luteola TaxID=1391654 RepID=A0A0K1Q7Z5_9BACT|nr:hypothetical protein [Labilithrix luteola]AKV01772.1 hypothetical protein AKJ09_08435 [Labilithrix luteola]
MLDGVLAGSSGLRTAILLLGLPLLVGCGRPTSLGDGVWGSLGNTRGVRSGPVEMAEVSQEEWTVSRERLARLREHQPKRPYVERVRLSIVEPHTRTRYEARGAVAVDPGRAARMIMVGPAGTTALDLWVTKERFRFAVPGIKLEKRGGTDPNEMRGLPVGFLRWWFLSPLGGRLLMGRSTPGESAWVLKDGPAIVTVRTDGQHFFALRREGERLEGIEWLGRLLVPSAGSRGHYIEGRLGLRVDIVVEEVLDTAPDPAAFEDPDAPSEGTTL